MSKATLEALFLGWVAVASVGVGGCDRLRARGGSGPDAGASSWAEAGLADDAGPTTDAGAAKKPAPGLPKDLNVLVLSIDSLRADMPWAGYPRPIAPRLTELESKSVSYTRGYSISSYTSMSLGGFLGGRYPSQLQRDGFFFGKYRDDNLFFPEVLQKNGIPTMAGHAHSYFGGAHFDQGFDHYEIVKGIVFKNETDPNVTSPKHEELAEKQLSDPALATSRFFAWYHFLDPHDQYLPHDADGIPPFGKTLRDRYDAEVLYTDRYIAKLLDFVEKQPWGARTAIIVTADHGEGFGEHGRYSHGFDLWENLVRVPLFFYVPGVPPRRIEEPRSCIDLAPTILELMGVPPNTSGIDFDGESLVPEILGAAAPKPRDVILDLPMTSDNDKKRALIDGNMKMLALGDAEILRLYDLAQDPTEDHPLTKGDEFDRMAHRFKVRSAAITKKAVAPYVCNTGCLNGAWAKK